MAQNKPIQWYGHDLFVVVFSLHAKGPAGPYPPWGMPADAAGCGDELKLWQPCTVVRGKVQMYGWMYDTSAAAEAAAKRLRAQIRRNVAKGAGV